jgi:hypothetical protein
MVLTITLGLISVTLSYVVWNLLRKVEMYEQTIEEFYSQLSITLHAMRTIDEKQMFESDDEVGEMFSQLVDTMSTLRPLLYGMEQNEEKED